MNKLYLLVFIIPLCQGFPLHSANSKSSSGNSDVEKSEERQYVQQPQGMAAAGTYNQYPSNYGTQPAQTQYGQQQYEQQQQQNTPQMDAAVPKTSSRPNNRGHGGVLYSHHPVPDPDKDISPPDDEKDEKDKKHKKKKSKSKKQDDDDDEEK